MTGLVLDLARQIGAAQHAGKPIVAVLFHPDGWCHFLADPEVLRYWMCGPDRGHICLHGAYLYVDSDATAISVFTHRGALAEALARRGVEALCY